MTYTRHHGGRGWRYDEDGFIRIEDVRGIPRTHGAPKTMSTMLVEYGDILRGAAERFDLDLAGLMAIVALESVPVKGTFSRNPASYRWEPRIEEPSIGLVQTLVSTAKGTNHDLQLGLEVTEESLRDPLTSVTLGASYLTVLAEKANTRDLVYLQAAYNAGALYTTRKNRWNMRTNSPDRTENFIRWHNDALAVLREVER